MSQREYLWCGDASFASQSAEDVITRTSTPVQVRSGRFGISFAQQSGVGDAGGGHIHTLLSMETSAGNPLLEIRLEPVAVLSATRGTSKITVRAAGSLLVTSPTFTHTEGNVVDLAFDAALGRVQIQRGHEEAVIDGLGTPWNVVDAAMCHGGLHGVTGQSARGNVSLPYLTPALSAFDSILDASAGTMVWRVDAEHFSPGTPPDVAAAPNRESETGYADIAQPVPSARPHSSGSGTDAVWDFDKSAVQELFNDSISPALFAAGDNLTLFLVAKMDNASASAEYPFDLTSNTAGNLRGVSFEWIGSASLMRVQFRTPAASLQTTSLAFSDTSDFHTFRASVKSGGVTMGVDGVENTVVVTTGGVSGAQTAISIGNNAGVGTTSFDGKVKFACALLEPSDAIIANVESAIQAYYGTPALP